jgi:hypothetical protein
LPVTFVDNIHLQYSSVNIPSYLYCCATEE